MNLANPILDWILSASLRASLLIPVVLVAQWCLRKHLPATWRYALWLPVLVVLLIPALPILPPSILPGQSITGPSAASLTVEAIERADRSARPAPKATLDVPVVVETASASVDSPAADRETSGKTAAPAAPAGRTGSSMAPAADLPAPTDWRVVTFWIWFGGAVTAGLLILSSFVMTMRRVKRNALSVPPGLLALVTDLASKVGLGRAPRVRRSSAVSSPAVCGLWRPVLLINERFHEDLSAEEMEMILRHELTHIRRGDLLLNALQCLLLALHWFNPLLWLAFFRARADREAACDEAVLRGEPALRRAAYGHTLLKMETEFVPSGLCLGFVGVLQGRGTLRTRIQSIIARRNLNAITASAIAIGIAVFTLAGITGGRAAPDPESTRTYPPTDGDFVKNRDGQGTAKVWGIRFEVEDPVGGASGSKFEGALHSAPEKTDARHEIKLGEDVTIRLEKVPGSAISFQFNGEDYGALEVGDRVVIDKERLVTVNKQPRGNPDFRPVWKKWQKDISAFDAKLQKLAGTAKIPDKEDLKKRLESGRGEFEVITDGYGGVVDFNPAEGTIQDEANKMIGNGGPIIDWQFELAEDAEVSSSGSIRLVPEMARVAVDGEEKSEIFRFSIEIAKAKDGPFSAGDRVRLRASIDDFSRFRKDFTRATGLVAIYHLEDSPNPVYCLRLDEAEVTLITTAEQRAGKSTPAEEAKAVADARQILMACQLYATDHDGSFPPSLAALLPDYLGPDAGSLLYTNPEEKKGLRWEYRAGLKATGPAETVLLTSTDLHGGRRIVGRVDGSVLPVEEKPEGGAPAKAEEHAAAAGGETIRWPSGRAFTVPAHQSLEIFRNEYKDSATKGMISSPNLSDWDYEDAYFGCGIDYKVKMFYKGTKAGKDYYLLKITYPENDKTRTVSRQLVYEGKEVEVFRDDVRRIVVRPQTVNFAEDLPKGGDDDSSAGLPEERGAQLPELAKAFPGEQLFNQTKVKGMESYGYATDLPFEELKKKLTAFLGEGWKETELNPSVAKDVTRQYSELLGSANFTNPAFPGVHIMFTQIEQEVDGRKSVASIMMGGTEKGDQR